MKNKEGDKSALGILTPLKLIPRNHRNAWMAAAGRQGSSARR
jgi:hypothetical protein